MQLHGRQIQRQHVQWICLVHQFLLFCALGCILVSFALCPAGREHGQRPNRPCGDGCVFQLIARHLSLSGSQDHEPKVCKLGISHVQVGVCEEAGENMQKLLSNNAPYNVTLLN